MQTRPPPCAAPTAARLRALFAGRRRLEGPPLDGPGPAPRLALFPSLPSVFVPPLAALHIQSPPPRSARAGKWPNVQTIMKGVKFSSLPARPPPLQASRGSVPQRLICRPEKQRNRFSKF